MILLEKYSRLKKNFRGHHFWERAVVWALPTKNVQQIVNEKVGNAPPYANIKKSSLRALSSFDLNRFDERQDMNKCLQIYYNEKRDDSGIKESKGFSVL